MGNSKKEPKQFDVFSILIQLSLTVCTYNYTFLIKIIYNQEFVESNSNQSKKAILKKKSDNKDIYLDVKEFLQKQLFSFNMSNNEGINLIIIIYLFWFLYF